MPIAEPLGVQLDMQLLLKLSISLATVLLVSWAYRFCNSREKRKVQLSVEEAQNAKFQECKTAPSCQGLPNHHTDDGDKRSRPSRASSVTDDLISDSTTERTAEVQLHRAEKGDTDSASYSDAGIGPDGEILAQQKQAEASKSEILSEPALKLPYPAESGMASTTGRLSPCFLQKLEGSVGVGRELRQDLECQGACSSFLSKAEIKVEDANVVLEGAANQIVRGKIYDYYVESSSHSVTDSDPLLGQLERDAESQPVQSRSRHGSFTDSLASVSPIIMRDLALPQNTAEEPSSPESLKLTPVLLRNKSYLSAAEHSELSSPFKTSTPVNHSPALSCSESASVRPAMCPSSDHSHLNDTEAPSLETVAGAPFLYLPGKTIDSTDLESLKSKLHLGNCLEVLSLAKKHDQKAVQQAALKVMSDNYFQVLRDPNLYGRLLAGERDQIQKQRMSGRKFVMVADMDPQDWARKAGGEMQEMELRKTRSALYFYNDYKNSWESLCPIPQEVISKACAMCTMDNYLFVALGCQGTDREMIPSKRVFSYNPLTSIWKEISPMNVARPKCKLAALEGHVYAIGGECRSSVERYDPRSDRWTFVASLPNNTFAVAHHVTACHGELFVSGGTLRYLLLRYSPKTDSWRTSVLVGRKARTADMVAAGRFLYRFDANPLLGLSVWRYHTMARLWYECSFKRFLRCPAFQCAVMDDTIYCVSRQFTMKFAADEISPAFIDEDLSVLSAAKGMLIPFVLSLPDKNPLQTSV